MNGDGGQRVEFGFCETLSLNIWGLMCIVTAASSRCWGSRSTASGFHNRLPSFDFGSQGASVRGCLTPTPDFESSVSSCPRPESDFGAADSTPGFGRVCLSPPHSDIRHIISSEGKYRLCTCFAARNPVRAVFDVARSVEPVVRRAGNGRV